MTSQGSPGSCRCWGRTATEGEREGGDGEIAQEKVVCWRRQQQHSQQLHNAAAASVASFQLWLWLLMAFAMCLRIDVMAHGGRRRQRRRWDAWALRGSSSSSLSSCCCPFCHCCCCLLPFRVLKVSGSQWRNQRPTTKPTKDERAGSMTAPQSMLHYSGKHPHTHQCTHACNGGQRA